MEAVAKEILAWRGWYLDLDDHGEWWLRSISMQTRWEGPTLVADKVPEQNSPHGVYALRERGLVGYQGYLGNCCGEVALSGIVVEGNNGYRAERATIRSLTLLGYPVPDVRPIEVMVALEDKYQCEVTWEEGENPIFKDKAATIQSAINAAAMQNMHVSYAPSNYSGTQLLGGLGNGILGYGAKWP